MHRQLLLSQLYQHQPADVPERAMTDAIIAFVEQNPDCFERSLLPGASIGTPTAPGVSTPDASTPDASTRGHITASALIVSFDRQRVVLIHHRKLNRWLQPGGHADGNPRAAAVAMQEAREETGLTTLRFVRQPNQPPVIFDVDIHPIPARAGVPTHLHYDIRFLLEADPAEPFQQNHETNAIRWFTPAEAIHRAGSESVARMIRKMRA